ncbi:hypothetical protein AK812_SmicGene45310 [Symbiodinium microadriaticum]|uniref:Uncharacterized protein n=1 Tax=Symbiodinium microadriaticum TaxID=2951 RepID=A0A1Q9BWA3_SYMMI|nr:hypothetical protein AK812_SmicGene45310 [Symbiodinium microadriaticum]
MEATGSNPGNAEVNSFNTANDAMDLKAKFFDRYSTVFAETPVFIGTPGPSCVAKVVLASTLAAVAVVTVPVDSVVPAAVLVAVSMHTVVKDCVVLVTVLVPVANVAVEVDSVVLVSVPVVVAAQVS